MPNAIEFPYTITNPALGASSGLPYLPFALVNQQNSVSVSGLLDSGAMVNVLPYQIGLQLGLVWAQQSVPLKLTGNLARIDARAVLLTAEVGKFASVRLAFAWTATDEAPLLLGQTNFFQEFEVCFFRAQSLFELKPKS